MPDPFTPPMTGALLTLLDDLRAGDWLALASANAPLLEKTRSLTVDAPLEDVAAAVFDILPISRDTRRPLAGWAVEADNPNFSDLASAVEGLAADGSGRRHELYVLADDVLVDCADGVSSTIRIPWDGAPFLFLVCVGGAARHQSTELQRPRALAETC